RPLSPLFPYTTLFRSVGIHGLAMGGRRGEQCPEREPLHEPRNAPAVLEDQRDRVGVEERSRGAAGAQVLVEEERDLAVGQRPQRSEEHTSELQSLAYL